VGIAAFNREGFVLVAKAFEANPYDGHTLGATVAQAHAMRGFALERVYVHHGYRGHDVADKERVYVAGQKRRHADNPPETPTEIIHQGRDSATCRPTDASTGTPCSGPTAMP
jgi:hypothetical protein